MNEQSKQSHLQQQGHHPQKGHRAHWYILGAGSLGCLWAAYLTKDGFECTLIIKDQTQLDLYQRQSYILLEKNHQQLQVPVAACLARDISSPIQHLLVTTKAHHCLAALKSVDTHFNTQTHLLLMQNGLGIQQEIANCYPLSQVYCGITTDGANRKKAFHVLHAGDGHTQVGPLFEKKMLEENMVEAKRTEAIKDTSNVNTLTQETNSLMNALPCISLSISYTPEIESALWYKLAINCAINGLTALHQCRNGKLAEIAAARAQIDALCKEIILLTQRLGIKLTNTQTATEQLTADKLKENVYEVITATAQNRSSMLQDVQNKRQTEIQFINGFLSEQAKSISLQLPCNEEILMKIRKLESEYS